MPNTRIKVPTTAKAGDVLEIRAEIQHPMENGFNVTSQGVIIPVEIITDFVCSYDGGEVFRVKLQPGLSANPYFSFFLKATKTGPVDFHWLDQNGTKTDATATLTVT
jgi:sulfur-oxidizing protein SoxZ